LQLLDDPERMVECARGVSLAIADRLVVEQHDLLPATDGVLATLRERIEAALREPEGARLRRQLSTELADRACERSRDSVYGSSSEKLLKMAFERDPENPQAYAHRGFLMLTMRNTAQAEADLRRFEGGHVVSITVSHFGGGRLVSERLPQATIKIHR
jgi:hypothetical protein